jgi:hypothetical protein
MLRFALVPVLNVTVSVGPTGAVVVESVILNDRDAIAEDERVIGKSVGRAGALAREIGGTDAVAGIRDDEDGKAGGVPVLVARMNGFSSI